jgi:GT2 family glycosyltransferase
MKRKRVYISVISHNQEDLIQHYYADFPKIVGSYEIKLSILDNTGSEVLRDYCHKMGYFYYHDGIRRGFGANHNHMFSVLNIEDDDIFIIANPDLIIDPKQLEGILDRFVTSQADLFTSTMYLDKAAGKLDFPDRYFPGILNFPISILTGKRLHYGSRKRVRNPEWISGAFIVFKPSSYRRLGGFDEGYFMYCEDIDLCYRAKKLGMSLVMEPDFYIEHDSRMQSRSLFSKNLYWHIKSTIRYLTKNKITTLLRIAKT